MRTKKPPKTLDWVMLQGVAKDSITWTRTRLPIALSREFRLCGASSSCMGWMPPNSCVRTIHNVPMLHATSVPPKEIGTYATM